MSTDASARATPYWLTGPALAVFLGLVIIPLGMTVRRTFTTHYRGVDMPHLAFAVSREAWSRGRRSVPEEPAGS